jgi:hypothetical protein
MARYKTYNYAQMKMVAVSYSFSVKGHCVAADVDSKTYAVLSVIVDYSRALVPENAAQQGVPADKPVSPVCG